jgi:hypothetical protein
LGFSQHFNADGSMYFTGNRMKVEFVTRSGEAGRARRALSRRSPSRRRN